MHHVIYLRISVGPGTTMTDILTKFRLWGGLGELGFKILCLGTQLGFRMPEAIFPDICPFVVPDSLTTYNWANPIHESPELAFGEFPFPQLYVGSCVLL